MMAQAHPILITILERSPGALKPSFHDHLRQPAPLP